MINANTELTDGRGLRTKSSSDDLLSASALYLSESLIDVSDSPNIISRLSAEDYLQVRSRGREFDVEPGKPFSSRAKSTTVFYYRNGLGPYVLHRPIRPRDHSSLLDTGAFCWGARSVWSGHAHLVRGSRAKLPNSPLEWG